MKKLLSWIGAIFGIYAIFDVIVLIAAKSSTKFNHWLFDDQPSFVRKVFFVCRK